MNAHAVHKISAQDCKREPPIVMFHIAMGCILRVHLKKAADKHSISKKLGGDWR